MASAPSSLDLPDGPCTRVWQWDGTPTSLDLPDGTAHLQKRDSVGQDTHLCGSPMDGSGHRQNIRVTEQVPGTQAGIGQHCHP